MQLHLGKDRGPFIYLEALVPNSGRPLFIHMGWNTKLFHYSAIKVKLRRRPPTFKDRNFLELHWPKRWPAKKYNEDGSDA